MGCKKYKSPSKELARIKKSINYRSKKKTYKKRKK